MDIEERKARILYAISTESFYTANASNRMSRLLMGITRAQESLERGADPSLQMELITVAAGILDWLSLWDNWDTPVGGRDNE